MSSVRITSSVQVDGDEENGFLRIDPSSGVTSLVGKKTDRLHPSTLLSQEPDEGSVQAIIPTRRTIAVPDSGDREDELPSWIFDALKVGFACAGQSFETYSYNGRTILLTLLEKNQSRRSPSDFQIFSLSLPSPSHRRVPHTPASMLMAPLSRTDLRGAFKRMTLPV